MKLILPLFIGLLCANVFLHAQFPTNAVAPPVTNKGDNLAEKKHERSVANQTLPTPIVFYGKVEDEKGISVKGAEVILQPFDRMEVCGNTYKQFSDKNGLFSISEVHGIGIEVCVSKKGYYITDSSSRFFGYTPSDSKHFSPHRDPKIPAVFILNKSGPTDPIEQYLLEYGTTTNDKIDEIDTVLGSKSTKVTMLSLISTNDAAIGVWSVYQKMGSHYRELTDYSMDSTKPPICFIPEYSTIDERSHSIIHYYHGGGGFGAISAITIVKGRLKDTCLNEMGPGTKDPDRESYQNYFPEGFKPVPVKIISLPYDRTFSPPRSASQSISTSPSPYPYPSP